MSVLELFRADAPAGRARALVFEDPASRALLSRIEQIAPTDANVLITGETGTGKEIVARQVHEGSARRQGPFVAVNCGALSASLIESELFGHEKGAFTGALASTQGWFEVANGGTLFLDEIGDLPLSAQVKVLRVLQEREVVRVGARRSVPIDVRLLAATNVKLEQAIAEGRFRGDLYYRLHVAHLDLPPLRDRPRDVLPLARHFLDAHAARIGVPPVELDDDAAQTLVAYSWPGNIRELENAMHYALLVAHGGKVTRADVRVMPVPPPRSATIPPARSPADPRSSLARALVEIYKEAPGEHLHKEIQDTIFRTAYEHCEKNQLRTARLLGVSRNIVRARLLEAGLLSRDE